MLKNMTNDAFYDKLMTQIQPGVIATTYGDPHVNHKLRQAKLIKAKLVYATKRVYKHSTTKYIKLINAN
jgi:hypothetical protein